MKRWLIMVIVLCLFSVLFTLSIALAGLGAYLFSKMEAD